MEQSVNGEKIKQLRLRNSWSQEKLAAASGLSLRTVQRIENEGVCSLESKQSIAATLQVNVWQLDVKSNEPVFCQQDLMNSQFQDSNLNNANFTDCNMCSAIFNDINLSNAQFSDINFRKARLVNVNLRNALFDDVNLQNAVVTDANIRGMKVNGYLLTDLIEHFESTNIGPDSTANS